MDPEATLAELRAVLAASKPDASPRVFDVARLVELVEALDGWLSKGGHHPRDWQQPQVGVLVEAIHTAHVAPAQLGAAGHRTVRESTLARLAVELAEQLAPAQVPA